MNLNLKISVTRKVSSTYTMQNIIVKKIESCRMGSAGVSHKMLHMTVDVFD